MMFRCDKVSDCIEHDDEENCDYFRIDTHHYNNEYPPIQKDKKMEVKINVVIEQLKNIKDLDSTFEAKFTIMLEWLDSRLQYKNLLSDELSNIVKEEQKSGTWIPPIVFNNTDENVMVIESHKTSLFIKKQGNDTKSPLTSVDEDFLYKGSENILDFRVGHKLAF
jgi:hypothetical protein